MRLLALGTTVALLVVSAMTLTGTFQGARFLAMLAVPPCVREGQGTLFLFPVDREHALPSGYVPQDLVKIPREFVAGHPQCLQREAADALAAMLQDAREAGHEVRVSSGFRSFDDQTRTYRYWAALEPDTFMREVAQPGHSEHQLGTAVDLTARSVRWQSVSKNFASSPEGRWIAAHAPTYGFLMSYPESKESATGYAPEAWHFRYVGKEAADAVLASGLTLREHLAQNPGIAH